MEYPAIFMPAEEGGFVVTFPDVPEANTQGDTFDEAMMMAMDALSLGLSFYVDERRPLPRPSPPVADQVMVPLPPLVAAKAALYEAMREHGVGKAELARRLNRFLPQIDRLLDFAHASRLDQLEAALAVFGKRVRLEVRDAA